LKELKIQLFGISEQLLTIVQNFDRFYEKNKVELYGKGKAE
jgi:hypothetical protein